MLSLPRDKMLKVMTLSIIGKELIQSRQDKVQSYVGQCQSL